jgi:hypothetical protein
MKLTELIKTLKEAKAKATQGPWDFYFATGEGPQIISYKETENGFRSYDKHILPVFPKTKMEDIELIILASNSILELVEKAEKMRQLVDDLIESHEGAIGEEFWNSPIGIKACQVLAEVEEEK